MNINISVLRTINEIWWSFHLVFRNILSLGYPSHIFDKLSAMEYDIYIYTSPLMTEVFCSSISIESLQRSLYTC